MIFFWMCLLLIVCVLVCVEVMCVFINVFIFW